MNANIAGIYGAQIFRADDKPLYRRGFSVAIAVLSVGLSLAIGRWLDGFLGRRRRLEGREIPSGSDISGNEGNTLEEDPENKETLVAKKGL
jgi:hypothetical protein